MLLSGLQRLAGQSEGVERFLQFCAFEAFVLQRPAAAVESGVKRVLLLLQPFEGFETRRAGLFKRSLPFGQLGGQGFLFDAFAALFCDGIVEAIDRKQEAFLLFLMLKQLFFQSVHQGVCGVQLLLLFGELVFHVELLQFGLLVGAVLTGDLGGEFMALTLLGGNGFKQRPEFFQMVTHDDSGEGQVERFQLLPDLLEPFGLFYLLPEQAHLLFDLCQHVVDSCKIARSAFELPEGLLASLLVPGDACGLFKQLESLLALVADYLFDHLQLDHRVGIAAHAGIGEKVEYVPEPALHHVQQVVAVAVAVKPSGDGDLGVFGRQDVACVLYGDRDLGEAEGLQALGAVENDALHFRRPEKHRFLLSEHPADGIDDVGFSTSVRTDDSRQTLVEGDPDPVGETFEAKELNFRQIHEQRVLAVSDRTIRAPGGAVR